LTRAPEERTFAAVAFRGASLVAIGAAFGALVMWALAHPSPGDSFPVVFQGRTQMVTADGDGVAFYPNERFADVFGTVPAFDVSGENRTSAVRAEVCLAPGTGEQDVVFAVVNLDGLRSLAWYACLTEGEIVDS
jgi:hypothetical protein